ncbi:hypothetical protein [Nonomuraea guangzhouensis]|uniref:Uncharacterized protein n=1 Tax=Nonomuraea guangzhouensis TaxID=1291555 RepID=A0ABW4GX42_9ACTN|nr:hypothetical protein [Nonomuraea guangzhouensis]
MSTNYYAVTPDTPDGDEGLHIGKHVGGKEFLFRAHRDIGLVSVAAWREFLSREDVTIESESGYGVAWETFMADATKRPADAITAGEKRMWDWERKAVSFRAERGVPFCESEFC